MDLFPYLFDIFWFYIYLLVYIFWLFFLSTPSALLCAKQEMKLNTEYRIMTTFAPDYDKLSPLNKLEIFQDALSQTDGQVGVGN